jgi:hypothetical protein
LSFTHYRELGPLVPNYRQFKQLQFSVHTASSFGASTGAALLLAGIGRLLARSIAFTMTIDQTSIVAALAA